ncbi:hypothetical protein ACW5F0_00510 [Luteimonas sp. A534]
MVVDHPRSGPGLSAANAALAPDAAQAQRILALLRGDDVDAAIAAGLAGFVPLGELDDLSNGALVAARDRLLAAWAARERHRARAMRLERIADERRRARLPSPGPVAVDEGVTTDVAAPTRAPSPSLPPAAAAALARAKARASGRES